MTYFEESIPRLGIDIELNVHTSMFWLKFIVFFANKFLFSLKLHDTVV